MPRRAGLPGGGSSSTLVIGASVSLTGDFADSGKAIERGYQLWADMVNAKGGIPGRKVSIKVVDDASSPTQVITNYRNLINKDHVDLTFGPFSILLTIPASKVAKRYGYAFLAPAGGGPDVFAQNLDNFFVRPAHVPQDRSLFPAMSVWDNLLMGGYAINDQEVVRERVAAAVDAFPLCATRARDHAGSLSGGERKQVELARTLVLDPGLILLDEPSIGLDPNARSAVFASIRQLAASCRTVLLVERNARSGLAASDMGAVLETGVVRLVATGADLLGDPEVARLYLGGNATASVGAAPADSTTPDNSERAR